MPDVEHSGCGCWCGAQENDVLVDADGVEDRALPADQVAHLGAQDPLRLRVLCAETVDAGHSVLLFCGAKKARPPRDPFCHWAAHACLSIVSLGQVFLALLPRRRALLAPPPTPSSTGPHTPACQRCRYDVVLALFLFAFTLLRTCLLQSDWPPAP